MIRYWWKTIKQKIAWALMSLARKKRDKL